MPHRLVDRIQQRLTIEWFPQDRCPPGVSVPLLGVRRDEDDRYEPPGTVQMIPQLRTRHARHADVEDQAVRLAAQGRLQEVVGGGIGLHLDADGLKETSQRTADGRIVIDHDC